MGQACPAERRNSIAISTLLAALSACACGGGGGGGGTPTQPSARAALQVSAAPSPAALAVCPPSSCGGAASPQFEVTTTLTLRETGGVSGRVQSVAVTLRRNSDNVVVLNATIAAASVQVAFAANGTATLPLAFHHDQADITGPTTATLVVNAVGDGGGPVTATTTLPVNGPATRGGLFITGNYQIVQAALTSSCGDSGTPATVTGWVTLTGPDTFQLRDTGGTTFTGTVQDDGRFVANAVFGPDAGGQTFTQRLEGAFGANAFTGLLSVTVQPRNCAFTRNWTATRLP